MSDEVVIVLTREEAIAVLSAIGWINYCFDNTNGPIYAALWTATEAVFEEIAAIPYEKDWDGPIGTPT